MEEIIVECGISAHKDSYESLRFRSDVPSPEYGSITLSKDGTRNLFSSRISRGTGSKKYAIISIRYRDETPTGYFYKIFPCSKSDSLYRGFEREIQLGLLDDHWIRGLPRLDSLQECRCSRAMFYGTGIHVRLLENGVQRVLKHRPWIVWVIGEECVH